MPVDFAREVVCLLGLPFDVIDMAGVLRHVRQAARERRPYFLSTPNLNWIVACLTDEEFRRSVMQSDLSIADGMPLVWMARLLGIPLRERIAGSTVFEALRSDASEPISVFFFGGQDGVAEIACQRLNAESSGLNCVGWHFPGFGSVEEMSSDETIATINGSGADFLVVSLGAKKGQAWITRNRDRISVPVISHLGAVVNIVARTASRAPTWMQGSGLEWLWRIKEEPILWRRYFYDGMTFLRLLITHVIPYACLIHSRKPTEQELKAAAIDLQDELGETVITLSGAWMHENFQPLRDTFSHSICAGKDVRLELGNVTYVDSAFIGLVMLLYSDRHRKGARLSIGNSHENVRRIFRYACAEFLFKANQPLDVSAMP